MKKILNVNVKTIENGIRSILINDPKSYNSLSSITLKSLITIFKKLNKDNTTKVIILRFSNFIFAIIYPRLLHKEQLHLTNSSNPFSSFSSI